LRRQLVPAWHLLQEMRAWQCCKPERAAGATAQRTSALQIVKACFAQVGDD